MAITTAICNSFKKEILQGVHAEGDTYKIALYTSAATLGASTATYSATNEVSGAGYTAGGKNLSAPTIGLAGSTANMTFTDPVWDAATITARGCLIYNASKGNKAVAAYDFGGDVVSVNGAFTVDLPAAGASSLVRIA